MTPERRRLRRRTGYFVVPVAFALVVWGTLAFGAVYPWGYRPLALAAAITGLAALTQAFRRGRLRAGDGVLLTALVLVIAGACVQTVPLPPRLRTALSPASEAYFREYDPVYRLAYDASRGAAVVVGALAPREVPRRPLSLDAEATWRGVFLLTAFTLLLAGLVRTFARAGITRVARWLIAFGVVVALIGIVQKAVLGDHAFAGMKIYGFWEPTYKLTTPFGPFVNKNHFAGWMLLALPLAMGYFAGLAEAAAVETRTWRERLLWLSSQAGGQTQLLVLAIAVMTLSLLMTLSRSGVGGLVIAVGLTSLAGARALRSLKARVALGASLAVLIVVAVQWSSVNLAARFDTLPGAVSMRLHAWQDGWTIVKDFPLTGTGLNTYGAATLKYQTGDRVLHFREAHNDYLQIAAEGGLLLGVPAGVALIAFVWMVRRRFARSHDDRLTHWVRVGATTGLVAIAVQSLVEFSLQMPGITASAVVVMAMALHEPMPDPQPRRHRELLAEIAGRPGQALSGRGHARDLARR